MRDVKYVKCITQIAIVVTGFFLLQHDHQYALFTKSIKVGYKQFVHMYIPSCLMSLTSYCDGSLVMLSLLSF